MSPAAPPTKLADQTDANLNPSNKVSNAAAPAALPGLGALLRGLTLILIAYAGSLGASIIGGALQTHYLTQLWTNRSSVATLGDAMSLILSGFFVFHLIAAAGVLLGLSGLSGAPPEARVARLSRAAMAFLAVSLGLDLLSYALSRYARELLSAAAFSQFHTGLGYVNTALDLFGTVFLIECLLRLRRYGAPDDREVAAGESLLRGALIGLFVARIIWNLLSYALRSFLSSAFGTHYFWPAYLMRALLSLLFFGTLLYLITATAKALREKPLASGASAAAAADFAGSAPAEAMNRGYRNLIVGALWAIGGIAVTVVTYQQASSSAGGRYMFAYGAIIFGLIQFIRGLAQVLRSS